MKDRPPSKEPEAQTPFERFRDLAQRLVSVDKKDIAKEGRRMKRRKKKR
jgi:hypothetical protein